MRQKATFLSNRLTLACLVCACGEKAPAMACSNILMVTEADGAAMRSHAFSCIRKGATKRRAFITVYHEMSSSILKQHKFVHNNSPIYGSFFTKPHRITTVIILITYIYDF